MPPKRASLRDRAIQDTSPPPAAMQPAADSPVVEGKLWGKERDEQTVVELELREIMPNRRQPRSNPAGADLDELAESIQAHGVIQPVIVRPIPLTKYEGTGRRYELVAGERRWRASAIAGLATIPALIRQEPADHRTMLELALIENVQRQDLHPLDEALAFAQLHDELGYSYSEIASRIGKSKAYVTNRMRLVQLDPDLRELVAIRPDTIKHVYELARIADPALRAPLIAAVRDEDLSRAETKARVDALLAPSPAALSVSQETDREQVHEDMEHSVSQETDRDSAHNMAQASSTSLATHERESTVGPEARFARDLYTIGRLLDKWEQQAMRDRGESRAALLHLIDEFSTRLERIARTLAQNIPEEQ